MCTADGDSLGETPGSRFRGWQTKPVEVSRVHQYAALAFKKPIDAINYELFREQHVFMFHSMSSKKYVLNIMNAEFSYFRFNNTETTFIMEFLSGHPM